MSSAALSSTPSCAKLLQENTSERMTKHRIKIRGIVLLIDPTQISNDGFNYNIPSVAYARLFGLFDLHFGLAAQDNSRYPLGCIKKFWEFGKW